MYFLFYQCDFITFHILYIQNVVYKVVNVVLDYQVLSITKAIKISLWRERVCFICFFISSDRENLWSTVK